MEKRHAPGTPVHKSREGKRARLLEAFATAGDRHGRGQCILDLYHVCEYLGETAPEPGRSKAYVNEQKEALKRNASEQVIKALRRLPGYPFRPVSYRVDARVQRPACLACRLAPSFSGFLHAFKACTVMGAAFPVCLRGHQSHFLP